MPSRYDPDKHHRRSIRLKGYDYSTPGAYFITALVKNRECILSQIRDGNVTLSVLGEIVNQCWNDIPNHFPSVHLDAFVIMPNHLHGIIVLAGEDARNGVVRATLAVAPNARDACSARDRAGASPAPTTLGDIVGAFKSLCFTLWYDHIKQNNLDLIAKFWHRNYYEHIVRNERECNRIREYIAANPPRWAYDRDNPNALIANDAWLADEKL